ncbi:unnamed protein product [Linum trigynum]|uniref:Uncharacterized protein n=1 Tax=Linum trigynum TaxID=586398 RepID=A0AAV2FUG9_9ROSI
MNSRLASKPTASLAQVHRQQLQFTVLVTVNLPGVSNFGKCPGRLDVHGHASSSRSAHKGNRELPVFHLFSRFSLLFVQLSTPGLVSPIRS